MMSNSRLTPLQQKILACLAQMDPPWTLIGGAALAGFHLHHRTTRDLDLFWSQPLDMSLFAVEAVRLLENEKLHCNVMQRTPTFVRLLVDDGRDQVKAAEQDSGFSAMTLAWVIGDLNLRMIGRIEKFDDQTIEKLERFKEELIERLMSPIKSELTDN
jgi:hypothetical protein